MHPFFLLPLSVSDGVPNFLLLDNESYPPTAWMIIMIIISCMHVVDTLDRHICVDR